MEYLEVVEQLFQRYGTWVLLLGLPLDMIALPIPPGNTSLTYSGYLGFKGVLAPLPAILAAYGGAIIGITITYLLGYRVGAPLVNRYGKWLLLKPAHMERTRAYYGKFGNALLLFSCFVPGLRQFAGYFVGILRIPYWTFALFAYTGAVLWVTVFFGIGYVFGNQWQLIFDWVEQYLWMVVIGAAIILVLVLIRWSRRANPHSGNK